MSVFSLCPCGSGIEPRLSGLAASAFMYLLLLAVIAAAAAAVRGGGVLVLGLLPSSPSAAWLPFLSWPVLLLLLLLF